jgi:hypothetical protein
MSDWLVRGKKQNGDVVEKTAPSRSEAEEKKAQAEDLGLRNLEVIPPGSTDGGESVPAEVVDHSPSGESERENESQTADIPDNPSVEQDPVSWMPDHFIDDIQGVPTVNRKGYAVIASQYGVSVTAEPVTLASDTDREYAEFRAIATTEDGQEYSGFGSAHVDRMDGDDEHLLNELAETRAMKRAVAWASGVGMTAAEEMMGSL